MNRIGLATFFAVNFVTAQVPFAADLTTTAATFPAPFNTALPPFDEDEACSEGLADSVVDVWALAERTQKRNAAQTNAALSREFFIVVSRSRG